MLHKLKSPALQRQRQRRRRDQGGRGKWHIAWRSSTQRPGRAKCVNFGSTERGKTTSAKLLHFYDLSSMLSHIFRNQFPLPSKHTRESKRPKNRSTIVRPQETWKKNFSKQKEENILEEEQEAPILPVGPGPLHCAHFGLPGHGRRRCGARFAWLPCREARLGGQGLEIIRAFDLKRWLFLCILYVYVSVFLGFSKVSQILVLFCDVLSKLCLRLLCCSDDFWPYLGLTRKSSVGELFVCFVLVLLFEQIQGLVLRGQMGLEETGEENYTKTKEGGPAEVLVWSFLYMIWFDVCCRFGTFPLGGQLNSVDEQCNAWYRRMLLDNGIWYNNWFFATQAACKFDSVRSCFVLSSRERSSLQCYLLLGCLRAYLLNHPISSKQQHMYDWV